jgi:hypothetical protein
MTTANETEIAAAFIQYDIQNLVNDHTLSANRICSMLQAAAQGKKKNPAPVRVTSATQKINTLIMHRNFT